ncbi:sugar-binding protein [Spirochaetia bacterium]|nr:sugar-binding protein [Spirochaetia bacterium]
MKKIFLVLMAVSLLAGNLFAGGGKQQSSGGASGSEVVTLTFWDVNPGPERTPYLEEIIKWYHESQDRIRIKYVGVPQSQSVDKINVAIAGNAVPDISGTQLVSISGFIAQKALLKLDDTFNAWSESKQFDPGVINVVRNPDPNRGLYMIPDRVSYETMWYRIDRFKDAGLGAPQSWDEFFNAVAKLTNASKGEYGFAIRGGSGSAKQLQTMLITYAGVKTYFDQNGNALFRDPAALEFLTRFAGIYNKYTAAGDVNYDYQAMVAAFDSGAANMIHHNLGSLAEHTKALPAGSFGTVFFPRSVKGYYCSPSPSAGGYSVFEGSKYKNEAIDFLKFLTSEKVISYWDQIIGELPSRLDVLEHDWVKNADYLKNITPVIKSPDTVYVDLPTYLPEYNRILTEIVEPGFQSVLLGRTTPKALLDEWATAIEQAYKRYQDNIKK